MVVVVGVVVGEVTVRRMPYGIFAEAKTIILLHFYRDRYNWRVQHHGQRDTTVWEFWVDPVMSALSSARTIEEGGKSWRSQSWKTRRGFFLAGIWGKTIMPRVSCEKHGVHSFHGMVFFYIQKIITSLCSCPKRLVYRAFRPQYVFLRLGNALTGNTAAGTHLLWDTTMRAAIQTKFKIQWAQTNRLPGLYFRPLDISFSSPSFLRNFWGINLLTPNWPKTTDSEACHAALWRRIGHISGQLWGKTKYC